MTQCTGKVYLLGAGLGEPAWLTLAARECLKRAEVAIYDALVDARISDLLPPNCLKIDVGKRAGKPSTPQGEINRLLVEQARLGKCVVRLKSGDPFIFGRAGEEIAALNQAGCPVEVLPGLSSALTAPLLAGIPLTDKILSRCFAVISAHEPNTLDWEAIARLDTLVILMGTRHLAAICSQLRQHGRGQDTEIAIIRAAGQAEQNIWQGTLDNIVDRTRGVSLSPAVIVIGAVVGLRQQWHLQTPSIMTTNRPLEGKTILVTRSTQQANTFTQLLQERGATVLEMAALEIRPPSSWVDLDGAIARLSRFDWLLLTSANGVNYFFARLKNKGLDARTLAGVKIAVVGKKTASVLEKYGLEPDFIPPDYIADALVDRFPETVAGQTFLFPRVETGGRETLVRELQQRGAEVEEVAAYQSTSPAAIDARVLSALQNRCIDIITFASSKTVRNFYQLLAKALPSAEETSSLLDSVCLASIGPQTSQTCRELFTRCDLEAEVYTLEGLTTAISDWAIAH